MVDKKVTSEGTMVFGLILRVTDDVIMNFSGSITKECRLYDAYPWCGLAYPWPKLIQVVDCGKFLNHTEYMYLRYELHPTKNLTKFLFLSCTVWILPQKFSMYDFAPGLR